MSLFSSLLLPSRTDKHCYRKWCSIKCMLNFNSIARRKSGFKKLTKNNHLESQSNFIIYNDNFSDFFGIDFS